MSNPSPTLASLSRRLTSTSQLLLERSRIISLNLAPSASSTNTIVRNLTAIKRDLQQFEDELEKNGLRSSSSSTGARGKGKGGESEVEKQVREIGLSYDRLIEMLSEDEGGRAKAQALTREQPKVVTSIPSPSASPDPFRDDQTPPRISLEPPTPIDRNAQTRGDSFLSNQSTTPFKDDPEDNPRITDSELLTSQQTLMDDQDERLNHLSTSIGRQNQLSMQIGDELDVHHQLLEDTDGAMDATAARLGRARKRLDKVADEAKQYGSTITIVALIFILLILIIVFKT